MEEKERLEKLEPAEALADRGEKTETIEAGSGRKDRREAGLNMDGELSVEAVRRWLLWAGLALGICLAASCILGTVLLMQNRKPAVLLTADGKDSRELVLNRKGGVIRKTGTRTPWRAFPCGSAVNVCWRSFMGHRCWGTRKRPCLRCAP